MPEILPANWKMFRKKEEKGLYRYLICLHLHQKIVLISKQNLSIQQCPITRSWVCYFQDSPVDGTRVTASNLLIFAKSTSFHVSDVVLVLSLMCVCMCACFVQQPTCMWHECWVRNEFHKICMASFVFQVACWKMRNGYQKCKSCCGENKRSFQQTFRSADLYLSSIQILICSDYRFFQVRQACVLLENKNSLDNSWTNSFLSQLNIFILFCNHSVII